MKGNQVFETLVTWIEKKCIKVVGHTWKKKSNNIK
jgi:hypothetical protein